MKVKSIGIPMGFIISILFFSSFLERPEAQKFLVDTKSSSVIWTGRKVTGEHTGTVGVSGGELKLDGNSISLGNFEIDLSSITVTDITDEGANRKLIAHLKSDDFFSVATYPKAKFVVSSATFKTGNEHLIKGNLTIKEITNKIEFPALIIRDEATLTATAKVILDRTKYDIRFRSDNFFENLGDKAIDDKFELDIKLIATVQKGI
jgi:polyisoprenoid-binding protein YceI